MFSLYIIFFSCILLIPQMKNKYKRKTTKNKYHCVTLSIKAVQFSFHSNDTHTGIYVYVFLIVWPELVQNRTKTTKINTSYMISSRKNHPIFLLLLLLLLLLFQCYIILLDKRKNPSHWRHVCTVIFLKTCVCEIMLVIVVLFYFLLNMVVMYSSPSIHPPHTHDNFFLLTGVYVVLSFP